ncbi:MAG: hypothetical protein R3E95_17070 [Thiolinea sp.]
MSGHLGPVRGTTWVPLTRYRDEVDSTDDFDTVMDFLDAAVGEHSARELREAFVRAGAKAIHTLVDRTEVNSGPARFIRITWRICRVLP